MSCDGTSSGHERDCPPHAPPPSQQYVAVMRHTIREDEYNENWVLTARRPWDPPISKDGIELVTASCSCIREFGFTKIVTSPFRRCVETAQLACTALGLPDSTIEIDWLLSEVLTGKLLNGHVWEIPHERISKWMIQDLRDRSPGHPEGLHGSGSPGVPDVYVNAGSAPIYPETMEAGHARYAAALQDIADRHCSCNILVVTHGEAVRQSVARVIPWALVFKVDHCGFTVSRRPPGEDGRWDWSLQEQQESRGVAWTA